MRKRARRPESSFAATMEEDDLGHGAPGWNRKDLVAAGCAAVAATAIVANALFLQKGPHPSPIFAAKPVAMTPAPAPVTASAPAQPQPQPQAPAVAAIAAPSINAAEQASQVQLPRRRPAEPEVVRQEVIRNDVPRPPRDVGPDTTRSIARTAAARPHDPIADMISPPTKRVTAVQRALADYGFGQIRPTGTLDRETQDAIEKFERSRRLPVTRQITPTLTRELSALIGRPIE